jgi:hypothetical protein
VRKTAAILPLLIALVAATPAEAGGQIGQPFHEICNERNAKGGATFTPLIRRAWAERKWRDATPVTRSQERRIRFHRMCPKSESAYDYFIRSARKQRGQFKDYRRHRLAKRAERRALTPYNCGEHGRFAIPCYVVACESGYDWGAVNPSTGAFTAYQFLPSTYRGACRTCDHRRLDFHYAATVVWNRSGGSEWVCA